MLVHELIERLQLFPPNSRVFINTENEHELEDGDRYDDYTADFVRFEEDTKDVTITTDPDSYHDFV